MIQIRYCNFELDDCGAVVAATKISISNAIAISAMPTSDDRNKFVTSKLKKRLKLVILGKNELFGMEEILTN